MEALLAEPMCDRLLEQDPPGRDAVRYGAKYCSEAMEYGEAAMKETRIECFRAGESPLSYCLPQVFRITCSGVLRTLICSYLDTGKERCLKIGKSYKMIKLCVFLGSRILSPVMQRDRRHPLFLGGGGRASPEIQADD